MSMPSVAVDDAIAAIADECEPIDPSIRPRPARRVIVRVAKARMI